MYYAYYLVHLWVLNYVIKNVFVSRITALLCSDCSVLDKKYPPVTCCYTIDCCCTEADTQKKCAVQGLEVACNKGSIVVEANQHSG